MSELFEYDHKKYLMPYEVKAAQENGWEIVSVVPVKEELVHFEYLLRRKVATNEPK